MKGFTKIFGLFLSLFLLFQTQAQADLLLNGAGASFPYPIYSKWFYEYNKENPSIRINYQSIGSGGGVRQVVARTVDFGASDAPMTDSELQKAGRNILHIPMVMGAVSVIYHLPGVNELKFSSGTLADIFMGKITRWNDSKIARENPGVQLPDSPVTVVHRSDGSGTTSIFTDYLTKVSTAWAASVGHGKAVKWPVGLGGKGNEGVSGTVEQIKGSIGYAELAYAIQNKLSTAAIQNRAGNFVKPSIEATSEAAVGAMNNIPSDYRVSITNAKGAGSYPISGFTWLLVDQKQRDATKGKALVEYLNWAVGQKAQGLAKGLNYAPLPAPLISRIKQTIANIEF